MNDRKELWKRIDEESDQICNDIFMKTGLAIRNISQFVNENLDYTKALPVLTEHLYRDYTRNTMETLVRSLTTPKARGIAAGALFDLYNRQPAEEENLRNVIGNALVYTAQEPDYDRLYAIIADKSNTNTAFNFIRALAKLKCCQEKTRALLFEILGERDLECVNKRLILLDTFRSLKAMKVQLPPILVLKYRPFKDRQLQKALDAICPE